MKNEDCGFALRKHSRALVLVLMIKTNFVHANTAGGSAEFEDDGSDSDADLQLSASPVLSTAARAFSDPTKSTATHATLQSVMRANDSNIPGKDDEVVFKSAGDTSLSSTTPRSVVKMRPHAREAALSTSVSLLVTYTGTRTIAQKQVRRRTGSGGVTVVAASTSNSLRMHSTPVRIMLDDSDSDDTETTPTRQQRARLRRKASALFSSTGVVSAAPHSIITSPTPKSRVSRSHDVPERDALRRERSRLSTPYEFPEVLRETLAAADAGAISTTSTTTSSYSSSASSTSASTVATTSTAIWVGGARINAISIPERAQSIKAVRLAFYVDAFVLL
jgi:hypothetical protein